MQLKARLHALWIFTTLIIACDLQKEYQLVPNGNEIDFEMQSCSPGVFYAFTNSLDDQANHILYGINGADSCVEMLNKETKIQTRIPLNWMLKIIGYDYNYGCYAYLLSKKLAWVDSGVSDSLYMVDLSQKRILKAVSKKLENGYSLYEMMEHFYTNNLTNDIIMRIHHPDKRSTFGVFKVSGNQLHLKKEMGFRPSIYQQKDMHLTNGALTVISADSLLISYHFSDSVDLYVNHEWKKRFVMKSNYSHSFKAFDGDHGDINAVYSQFLMHQRYDYILFDPKQHLYYRIFVHGRDKRK